MIESLSGTLSQEFVVLQIFGDFENRECTHWAVGGQLADLLEPQDKLEIAEAVKGIVKKATQRAVAQLQ